MNILEYNREAWTREVADGNKWTVPVDAATIDRARRGDWSLVLTPTIPVPRAWYGELRAAAVLCLASGGGQQAPVLAAAGAQVTVLDNCPAQLERDRLVAEREGFEIRLEQGDMRDLSRFADGSFDLIFHPVSNCFIDDVRIVWKECSRVLREGGRLLAGFCNPITYMFDLKAWDEKRTLTVRYRIPYSDLEQLPSEELEARMAAQAPLEFGHTLDDQIGGQIAAGFSIAGFYEDDRGGDLLDPYIKSFIATLAIKSR
ncbi:MAG TPA: class I SAM-dependent methyltransferase [Rectinemataceae bacterium]|nr:class I SAM-dependent methyltransferase [Rectinemataceae bacterium]